MIEYIATIAILAGINVILAASFNLVLGYGGLVSVAHPVFFAIGAYASALLAMHFALPIPLAIACGAVIAGIASAGLSIPALRVSGDYLVITSLGLQLGLVHVINNVEFTGAAGGLSNIPAAVLGPSRTPIFLAVTIVAAALSVWFIRWLMHGDYGRAVTAMRNDEDALAALGRSPIAIKVALFALGCGMAGFAGGLYAHHFLYLTPEQFGIFASSGVLTMVVVGGAATTWGPVVGALVMTLAPEAIRFLDLPLSIMAPAQGVVFSVLVLAFLFLRPQGLLGGRRAGGGVEGWKPNASVRP